MPIPRAALCGSLVVLVAVLACADPKDQRPGLRLGGEVVAEYPDDWSFSNQHREIALEVATPYLIPHSVTIWSAASGPDLYVAARNPDTKRWPRWVERDPEVRLGIGDRVYEAAVRRIDDPAGIAAARRAYAAKYDLPARAPADGPPMRYWRVVERGLPN